MPKFMPFRGYCYNAQQVGNLTDVITPPYDVISQKQQDDFYEMHPKNIIRVVLNRPEAGDTEENAPALRAAEFFTQWRADGTLERDAAPAYYLTAVDFTVAGRPVSRFGLTGMIRVEPFENGNILPHERTFSKVRTEQMHLLRATKGNFCPIFSVYSDAQGIIQDITRAVTVQPPDTVVTDGQGLTHRMWRITDPALHERIQYAFENTTVFIADGHHRYETAMNYQKETAATDPGMGEDHPANYTMMYMSSLEDPGLVILPAHRLLKDVPAEVRHGFIEKASACFDVDRFPFAPGAAVEAQAAFLDCISQNSRNHAFGVCIAGDPTFYCLRLKAGVMEDRYAAELPPVLLDLDVTVVTRLAFMDLLGFDQARLDDVTRIGYASTAPAAIEQWLDGTCDMAFILNATRIDQVEAVCRQGLIMPRKSTYFYPKTISGQVLHHQG